MANPWDNIQLPAHKLRKSHYDEKGGTFNSEDLRDLLEELVALENDPDVTFLELRCSGGDDEQYLVLEYCKNLTPEELDKERKIMWEWKERENKRELDLYQKLKAKYDVKLEDIL